MENVTQELQKTTNYARLMEEKIQAIVQGAKARAEAEEEAQGENVQEAQKAKKKKGVDENAIRKLAIQGMHDAMDKQVA